ncbi:MAG: exodeoxyribonuclease VII small subunit [Anaerolineae bacterium]
MTNEVEGMTFEEAFAELDEVASTLDEGGLTLEDSLALFERGQALAAYCARQLDEAELKVRQITPEGDAPFDPER